MEFFDNVHGGKTLIDLVTYFDQTYVNGTYRRGNARRNSRIVVRLNRSPPLFPPPLWNAFESTVAGSSRTNNACEGWKDQALAATAILQDARGQPATKRQKNLLLGCSHGCTTSAVTDVMVVSRCRKLCVQSATALDLTNFKVAN